MSKPIYFEDLELNSLRETTGRTITEADIVFHAGHTGDFFPHHMDAEFAKTTPFGQRIAHGTMTFAIAVGLKAATINPASFTYGYDHLRFPKPVFIGDTIRVRAAIASKEPYPKRPEYGRYVERVEVLNQHNEIVLVFDHIGLIQHRPRG
jgi:acyl dehydratase